MNGRLKFPIGWLNCKATKCEKGGGDSSEPPTMPRAAAAMPASCAGNDSDSGVSRKNSQVMMPSTIEAMAP